MQAEGRMHAELLVTTVTAMDVTAADAAHRDRLRAFLEQSAEHLGCRVTGEPDFGWWDRTIGATGIRADGTQCWMRVVSEQTQWAEHEFWTGNADANDIHGVPKPVVLDSFEQHDHDRWLRAELMTLVEQPPVSTTPELTASVHFDAHWLDQLDTALATLASHRTHRVAMTQHRATQQLREYFGERIDPAVDHWTTAHTDLHWGNLTAPDLTILDWEGWGQAPSGYDAATLYCHSLLVPDIAETINERFNDLLETPDGRRSQLLAIARMLRRTRQATISTSSSRCTTWPTGSWDAEPC